MTTTDAEAIARIIEAEIEHDIKSNIAWANGRRAANAILSYLASRETEPEYIYDDARFNKGVQHVVEMLARNLGVTDWVAGDGSESYDDDLWQTVLNILATKGLYDADSGEFASRQEAQEPVAPFAEGGYGSRLLREAVAYLNEYVFDFDSGADHDPTEFERFMMEDMLNGLFSHEPFFGVIRNLAAPPAPAGEVER